MTLCRNCHRVDIDEELFKEGIIYCKRCKSERISRKRKKEPISKFVA